VTFEVKPRFDLALSHRRRVLPELTAHRLRCGLHGLPASLTPKISGQVLIKAIGWLLLPVDQLRDIGTGASHRCRLER